jgi:hypothetical protein
MCISRKSPYTPYNVDQQRLKSLHNSLHFLQSAYTVGNQQPKSLHYRYRRQKLILKRYPAFEDENYTSDALGQWQVI